MPVRGGGSASTDGYTSCRVRDDRATPALIRRILEGSAAPSVPAATISERVRAPRTRSPVRLTRSPLMTGLAPARGRARVSHRLESSAAAVDADDAGNWRTSRSPIAVRGREPATGAHAHAQIVGSGVARCFLTVSAH